MRKRVLYASRVVIAVWFLACAYWLGRHYAPDTIPREDHPTALPTTTTTTPPMVPLWIMPSADMVDRLDVGELLELQEREADRCRR